MSRILQGVPSRPRYLKTVVYYYLHIHYIGQDIQLITLLSFIPQFICYRRQLYFDIILSEKMKGIKILKTTEYAFDIFFSFHFHFPFFSVFTSCFSIQNQQIYSRYPYANKHILVLTDYSEVQESIHEADTTEESQNLFPSPRSLNWNSSRKSLSRQLLNTQVSDPG